MGKLTIFFIEYPIVIIASTKIKLFVILIDSGTDGYKLSEIKWSALDLSELACRN